MADLPLFPRLLPALVESASAVAGAEAAAAVVGILEVGSRLEAGVELAEAVGEETELGGSVDGTELSLFPGSAVVGCALEELSAEALDGATAKGVFGVALGLVEVCEDKSVGTPARLGAMVSLEQGVVGPEVDEVGEDKDIPFQGSGEPSTGLRATGELAEVAATLNSKKASGVSQHWAFSSAKPQQNLAARSNV